MHRVDNPLPECLTCMLNHLFQALATELGEGAFVGTLEPDSRNVVELVETLYNVSHICGVKTS